MLAGGVTTVEIKSGYGLSPEHEAKMLRAARAAAGPVDVVTTFLGAHARPPGRGDYVDEVVGEQLDACAGLADAIDVYCDRGAFTLHETERVLRAGKARGLAVRVHAEQVAYTGAAALAASMGALSADHLEQLDDAGVAAMAAAGTVAVLLPGAMLYLRDPAPPVAKLRAAGVPLAVGTDFNPGSSPVRDLWGCATLACLTMGFTVREALAGITSVAARALGKRDVGVVRVGAKADLALYAPPPGEPAEARVLVQYLGPHRASVVLKDGVRVC
jgi:imidazolonepropionase